MFPMTTSSSPLPTERDLENLWHRCQCKVRTIPEQTRLFSFSIASSRDTLPAKFPLTFSTSWSEALRAQAGFETQPGSPVVPVACSWLAIRALRLRLLPHEDWVSLLPDSDIERRRALVTAVVSWIAPSDVDGICFQSDDDNRVVLQGPREFLVLDQVLVR